MAAASPGAESGSPEIEVAVVSLAIAVTVPPARIRAAERPWWPAPAKLNLFLHVTGRRPDGFHDLQTIFQLLDWGDELGITATADGAVERAEGPPAIRPQDDLCVRAALALKRA